MNNLSLHLFSITHVINNFEVKYFYPSVFLKNNVFFGYLSRKNNTLEKYKNNQK